MNKYLWELKRFGGFFYRAGEEFVKKGWVRRNARYVYYYEKEKVKENVVMYESFFGRGMLCGPYALFEALLNDPAYCNVNHIWVLDNPTEHQELTRKYKDNKNVHFVKYLSREYLKALSIAKYLINNVTFPSFFVKKNEQIYINTWHGIPLKKLGFDMPQGAKATKNIIRNFLVTDYLVSANPFLTDIYMKAYKLEGIFAGKIIEEGYPRLDILVKHGKDELIEKIRTLGVQIDENKKIIIYAPTWRENDAEPLSIVDEYGCVKMMIEQQAPEYQVLIKVHQFVYQLIKESMMKVDYIIPATVDANEVLPIADILISDYSSIYFDYLYFERPILFYIKDLSKYTEIRGLYTSVDKLPGPCSANIEDIISWIHNIDIIKQKYRERIIIAKNDCCRGDIGNISKHIIQTVFENTNDNSSLAKYSDKKKKILIHRGRMRVNGITTSFLNLLNEFDYTKYDVSVFITNSKDEHEQKLIETINPNVRVIMRESTFNFSYVENVRNRMSNAYGVSGIMQYIFPKKAYQREVRRCFGNSHFDAVIDFEGYNLAYAMIVATIPCATHAIWQHNDMDGERKMKYPELKSIFSTYPYFERIVSCCEAIMKVNRKNLSNSESYSKFTYASNLINYKRVHELAAEENIIKIDKEPYILLLNRGNEPCIQAKAIPLQLASCDRKKSLLRFVAVGRLSPEKNYLNLIQAFKQFCDKGYNAMLYIVGEGPQKKELKTLIKSLNLTSRIVMTGNITNPITVMKNSHCFILPSIHEGQPMVILEARILRKPIIMSNFSSSESSKILNGQYMVEQTVEGILDGFVAYTKGYVPENYEFDGAIYNQKAYREFLKAVELE